MTSTNSSESESALILKTDTLDRVQTPRERREAILDEFDHSGMTGAAFAKHYGIKYTTFAWWRQQRARIRKQEKAQPDPVQLAEVVVESASSARAPAEGLRIELPGGAHVMVTSGMEASLAAAVLRALGEDRSC